MAVQVKVAVPGLHNGPLPVKAPRGVGFTLTEKLAGVLQPFEDSVIKYVTSTGAPVVFINVSDIDSVLPLPAVLLIPVTTGLVQENVVPVTLLVVV